jgi:hypothetical protein
LVNEDGSYEDLLTCLFVPKRHQAMDRRIRADKRVEFVHNKFKDLINHRRIMSEEKINENYEKLNKTISDKINK